MAYLSITFSTCCGTPTSTNFYPRVPPSGPLDPGLDPGISILTTAAVSYPTKTSSSNTTSLLSFGMFYDIYVKAEAIA
jgi:hypothetical protein